MVEFLKNLNSDIWAIMLKSIWFNVFIRIIILVVLIKIVDVIFRKLLRNVLLRTTEIEAIKQIKTLFRLLHTIINTLIAIFVILAFLGSIGVNIKPLLATAGVAGFAVGYASKRFIEDIIAGIIIITSGQIRMGDYVNIAGKEGTVENIDLKIVTLRDINGNVHYIRNGLIDVVTNYTRDYSYCLLDLGVSYNEDPERVMEVLQDIFDNQLKNNPNFSDKILDNIEIQGLNSFEDSSIIIRSRIKTVTKQQWIVGREFKKLILQRFKEENIEIPYKYQNIFIKNSDN